MTTLNTVNAEIEIKLSKDDCWEKMRDLRLARNYVPNVPRIIMNTRNKEGTGVQRTAFSTQSPGWTHETVTRWVPGTGFTLRLHRGKKPTFFFLNELQFHYDIEEAGVSTLFKPGISFAPRFKLTEKLARKNMSEYLWAICFAMKEFYETETPVSPYDMIKHQQRARAKVEELQAASAL